MLPHDGQGYSLIARTNAATAGEKRRPATATSDTSRVTSGSTRGPGLQPGQEDRVLWQKADADPRHNHGLDPVLALAAIGVTHLDALLLAQFPEIILELAVDTQQIALAVHFGHAHAVLVGEAMARRKGDDEALAVQGLDDEPLLERLRLGHEREIELALAQQLGEHGGHALAQGDLHTLVGAPEVGHETDAPHRTDGTHHTEIERRVLEFEKAPGRGLGTLGLLPDLLELRPDQPPEVDQVGQVPLAPEEEPAELLLELLDRAGERRLGDVTLLGRAREFKVSQAARK
jgi:hypothetical protein